jgi:hypothetical protein
MKRLVLLLIAVLALPAHSGDFVTNPAATIPPNTRGTKADARPLPAGADHSKFLTAADFNEHGTRIDALASAVYDLREALKKGLPAAETGKFLRWKADGSLENVTVSDILDSIAGATAPPGERYWIDTSGAIVPTDSTAPTVTAFSASPGTGTNANITLAATDAVGVTGYYVSTSGTTPASGAGGWTSSAPTTFAIGSYGAYTLYAWAKDAAANISTRAQTNVTLTSPSDSTAPTITAFTMPSTASSLSVAISSFTATDAVGVTGYLVKESSTAPTAGDAAWQGTAPTSFGFAAAGARTAYAFAKDAAGNVSSPASAPVTITLPGDSTPPSVTAFALGTPAGLTVPISTFTATDAVGVTGFKVTETTTAPLAGDAGWTGTAPTSYTFLSAGTYTLRPWAKDAAGNVSALHAGAGVTVSDPPAGVVFSDNFGSDSSGLYTGLDSGGEALAAISGGRWRRSAGDYPAVLWMRTGQTPADGVLKVKASMDATARGMPGTSVKIGLVARYTPGSGTSQLNVMLTPTGVIVLQRAAGSWSTKGTYAFVPVADTEYLIELSLIGASLSVKVDGVERITTTTTVTAAGEVGIADTRDDVGETPAGGATALDDFTLTAVP